MWFLASLACLLVMVAVVTTAGTALVDLCLPWRQRSAAREFLAPTLGLALLLVPVNLLGWLGHGFHGATCGLVTVALLAGGLVREVRRGGRRRWVRHGWRLAGFAGLGSFPMLGQLLRFNTFNPFNDTWTYLYQAQWLQRHGFGTPALVAGHHPAAVAVRGFQESGLRITPSFLLGWLQAAFGFDWSYEAYPATVSLILICGALAVGGIVRAAFPGRRREAWWVALAAAVTLNGFAFGAVGGFLPQTVGLAFSTAALALRGLELANHRRGDSPAWPAVARTALPLGACVAAVVYCYPELLPFLAPALAASYLLPWPTGKAQARARALALGAAALTAAVLAGGELPRAFHALLMQARVVAGNPVAWTPGGFLAQSLGLRAGIYEGGGWMHENGWGILWAGLVPVACFGGLLWWADRFHLSNHRARGARWALAAAPAALMAGLCTVAFVYFRYGVANPWPNGLGPWKPGVGQTWSQLKLSLWVSPALLALAGVGIVWLSQRRGALAAVCLLAGWCAAGLGWNGALLLVRVNPIRLVSGEHDDPFGSYRAWCEPLAELPASDVIYLEARRDDFGSIKQRELLAYFLGDHPLIGDWTVDDNLPAKYFPPAELKLPPDGADWIVRYDPAAGAAAGGLSSLCGLTVSRVAHEGWTLAAVTGGYDREHEANGKWYHWTAHELHLTWRASAPASPPRRMKLCFEQHSFAAAQTVTVRIEGAEGGDRTFTVNAPLENRREESEPFLVSGGEVRVSFTGSGQPVRASAADARELSYLIASATLEPVKD